MAQNESTFKHWEPLQDLLYNLYLIFTSNRLKSSKGKKENGFYVEMADFIQTKDQVQCRSHHEKKIKAIKKKLGANDKEHFQLINLKNFYKSFYTDRLLDLLQLLKELKHHLTARIKKHTRFQNNYKMYYQNVEQVVYGLKLEEETSQKSKPPEKEITIERQSLTQGNQGGLKEQEMIQLGIQSECEIFLNRSELNRLSDDYEDFHNSLFFNSH